MAAPLNILIVATKPPWPPVDGGRVVVLNTVDALAAAGHRITLVAPVDPGADHGATRDALAGRCRAELVPVLPPGMRAAALSALLRGRPLTVERHRLRAVADRVRRLIASERFDLVQAEQLQAVAQAAPAAALGIPLIYRAHNIESVLWSFAASFGRAPARALLRLEARRLAVFERSTVRSVAATVVLTELDAAPLREAAGRGARIERVPVPFAPQIAASDARPPGTRRW
jgi:hypothetical protein